MTELPKCRHCGERPANRPRGLCWRDFYTPGVKELYPSTSKYARRGSGGGTGPGATPTVPCPHAQGSPGRIETLAARAAAGESLWHPGDCREITADADGRAGHAA